MTDNQTALKSGQKQRRAARHHRQLDSSSEGILEFLRRNSLILGLGALLLFLYFLPWLADSKIGIDSFIFISDPGTTMNWLDIERPAMVLLHKLFYSAGELSMFYCEGMAYLLSAATMILYAWILFRKTAIACWQSVLFFLLMLLHPLLTEQFYFTIQMADIMAGYLICGIALNLAWSRKPAHWPIASLLIVFLLALYQSFAPFYISFCLLLFCLVWIQERRAGIHHSGRYYLRFGLRQLMIFLAGFLFERIFVGLFFSGGKEYLSAQSNWGKISLGQILATIFAHFKIMLTHGTAFYPLTYPITMILSLAAGIWMTMKSRFRYGGQWFLAALVLYEFSSLLMTVYLGNYPAARSILNLPLISAGNFLLLLVSLPVLHNRHWKSELKIQVRRTGAILLCIGALLALNSEYYMSSLMQYTSRLVKEDDEREARNIEQAVLTEAGQTAKPVVLVGYPAPRRNKAMIELEIQTVGVFRHSYAAEPRYEWLNDSVHQYMESLGIYFNAPDAAQIDAARNEAATMPVFPQTGSVRETDTIVVVKLGNDDWYELDQSRGLQSRPEPATAQEEQPAEEEQSAENEQSYPEELSTEEWTY